MTKDCGQQRDVSLLADIRSGVEELNYDNIVLNIPHASVDGLGEAKWNNKVALMKEVRKWTDWFTDVIFVPDNQPGIKSVVADYSRFVVDVQRLLDDPMNEIGQGIIYTKFNGLQRKISAEGQMGMMAYYYSYINQLKSMLNEHSLLIDCHSFPSVLSDVDVCIGVNDNWSRPTKFLVELVMEFFKQIGYTVTLNTPFSNAIAPTTNFRYDSIKIELNKRIYLNEDTLELLDSARSLRNSINKLYGVLLHKKK